MEIQQQYLFLHSQKKLMKLLKLLEEKLFKPGFNEEDLKTLKKQQIEFLNSQMKNHPNISPKLSLEEILFGDTRWIYPSEKTIKKN